MKSLQPIAKIIENSLTDDFFLEEDLIIRIVDATKEWEKLFGPVLVDDFILMLDDLPEGMQIIDNLSLCNQIKWINPAIIKK